MNISSHLSPRAGFSGMEKLFHTVIDCFPAHIITPERKYTCIRNIISVLWKYKSLKKQDLSPKHVPIYQWSSSWHLAHKMLEEMIEEVALCRCWHLTDHTAVISPLHLRENVNEKLMPQKKVSNTGLEQHIIYTYIIIYNHMQFY